MRHQTASCSRFHCIACNIPFHTLEDQKQHYFAYHSLKVVPTPTSSKEKVNEKKSVEFKCEPCNIVCLSAIAYDFHTQGKKHKAAISQTSLAKFNQQPNGKIISEAKNGNNTLRNNFVKKSQINAKEKTVSVMKNGCTFNGKTEMVTTKAPANTAINNFIKKKDVKINEVNKILKTSSEECSKVERTVEIISRIKQRVSLPASIVQENQSCDNSSLTKEVKLENGYVEENSISNETQCIYNKNSQSNGIVSLDIKIKDEKVLSDATDQNLLVSQKNAKAQLTEAVNQSLSNGSLIKNEAMVPLIIDGSKCYLCNYCNISCTSVGNLEMHFDSPKHKKRVESQAKNNELSQPLIRELFTEPKQFQCKLCLVRCNTQAALEIHIATLKHTKPKTDIRVINDSAEVTNFYCDDCLIKFPSEDHLRIHLSLPQHRTRVQTNRFNGCNISSQTGIIKTGSGELVPTLPVNDNIVKFEFFCVDCSVGCNSMEEHLTSLNHMKMVQLKSIDDLKKQRDPLVYCDVCDLFFLPNLKDWHYKSDKHKRECKRETKEEPAIKKRRILDIKTNVNYCHYCLMNLDTEAQVLEHYQSPVHLANFDKVTNPVFSCQVCALKLANEHQLQIHRQSFAHYAKVNENNMNPEGEFAERLMQQRVNRCMRPPRRVLTGANNSKFGDRSIMDIPMPSADKSETK